MVSHLQYGKSKLSYESRPWQENSPSCLNKKTLLPVSILSMFQNFLFIADAWAATGCNCWSYWRRYCTLDSLFHQLGWNIKGSVIAKFLTLQALVCKWFLKVSLVLYVCPHISHVCVIPICSDSMCILSKLLFLLPFPQWTTLFTFPSWV